MRVVRAIVLSACMRVVLLLFLVFLGMAKLAPAVRRGRAFCGYEGRQDAGA
ncbi:hypothetical protein D3C71_2126960 [compost metagenome]